MPPDGAPRKTVISSQALTKTALTIGLPVTLIYQLPVGLLLFHSLVALGYRYFEHWCNVHVYMCMLKLNAYFSRNRLFEDSLFRPILAIASFLQNVCSILLSLTFLTICLHLIDEITN